MMSIAIVIIVCVAAAIYAAARRVSAAAPIAAAITATPEPTPEEYAAATAAAKITCDATNKIADDFDRLSTQYQKALAWLPANFFKDHPVMTEVVDYFKIRAHGSKLVADGETERYEAAKFADVVAYARSTKAHTDACINRRDLTWKEYADFRSECNEEDQQQLDRRDELKASFDTACADAITALNVSYYAGERVHRP
jgi:hypothetical protein